MNILNMLVVIGILILSSLLLVGGGIGIYLLLRGLLSEMAKRNILVTFRVDGVIKAIMKGKKLHHFLMRVKNHVIDPESSDIIKASLNNLGPVITHLWNEGQRLSQQPGFQERKLQSVEKEAGESDSEFIRRIERRHRQTPSKIDIATPTGTTTPAERWFIFTPEFHKKLLAVNRESWLEKWFGVAWVGFPPMNVFVYKFRWLKYAQEEVADGNKPSSKVVVTPKEEYVDSLYFEYPVYALEIDDAETGAGTENASIWGERIKVKALFILETETRNPHKTLFRVAGLPSAGEWLSALMKETRDPIRIWIGESDYSTLQGATTVRGDLTRIREEINTGLVGGTRQFDGAIDGYGQIINKLRLINVDLLEPGLQTSIDEVFQAKQAVLKAEQEALRDENIARGKKALAAAPYLGEAEGMARIAAIPGGAGTKMRVAKSIGEGGIKILSVGGGGTQNLIQVSDTLLGETEEKPKSPTDKAKP